MLDALSPADWQDLAARARRQRVRPMILKRLTALGGPAIVPAETWDALKAACTSITFSNMFLHAELGALVKAFDAEGIPLIALKGIHVATAVYGDLSAREMSDIDVLIAREHLERAAAIALANGYTSTEPLSVATDVAVSHHLAPLTKARARVEIHWNIVEPRRSFSIDPGPLFERSVPLTIPGARLRALGNEDLVLHLCAHTAYSHRFEFGLRSLCDLAALVERQGGNIDWALVARQADAWRWSRAIHLALDLARELLGAPVPDAVLRSFGAGHDDRVRAAAKTEMLAGWDGTEQALPFGVSSLATIGGPREAWRHVMARVFVDPHELVRREGVAVESARWRGLLYLKRAFRLARRDGPDLVRLMLLGDRGLTEKTDRRDRLMSWLGLSAH